MPISDYDEHEVIKNSLDNSKEIKQIEDKAKREVIHKIEDIIKEKIDLEKINVEIEIEDYVSYSTIELEIKDNEIPSSPIVKMRVEFDQVGLKEEALKIKTKITRGDDINNSSPESPKMESIANTIKEEILFQRNIIKSDMEDINEIKEERRKEFNWREAKKKELLKITKKYDEGIINGIKNLLNSNRAIEYLEKLEEKEEDFREDLNIQGIQTKLFSIMDRRPNKDREENLLSLDTEIEIKSPEIAEEIKSTPNKKQSSKIKQKR